MANTLPSQHILELTFDVLTAAVGIVVIILGLRIKSTLSLSIHRRALWISFGAVALIVASNIATVWANLSRISTFKHIGAAFAELVAAFVAAWEGPLHGQQLRRAAHAEHPTDSGDTRFRRRGAADQWQQLRELWS